MIGSAEHALYARFLRGLAASPEHAAVRVESETITYEQAHERALGWAGAILTAADEPPTAIGVLADKGMPAYVGILAGLYAGAAVVPLRPDFPVPRTRQMLDVAGVSALIVDESGGALLPELLDHDAGLPVLPVGDDPGTGWPGRAVSVQHGHLLDQPRPVAAADPAYVLFTSGSTGRPKAVPITHGNTDHYFRILDARYDFTPDDVFSQTFDLNFDCAMFDLFCAWGAGAQAIWPPPRAYREMPAFLTEHRVTVWFSTPSSITLIRRMGGLAANAMPALRWSFFAGEALKCRDAADWQLAAPGSVVENLYGPTELTITCAAHRWSGERSALLGVNGVVPIGVLNEGHEEMLLDGAGEPAETEGELCVSGPQMTPGYLDRKDNENRFLEWGARRWYRTGDRVRRVGDGELVYLGRDDAQVQVHGWRVELTEIDHAVRSCAGIEDAITVSTSADGDVGLVAFYTGTPASPAELARQLRQSLPQGLIPRHYRHLDEFPLNSNRKVDRAELKRQANELLGIMEKNG